MLGFIAIPFIFLGINILTLALRYEAKDECEERPPLKLIIFFILLTVVLLALFWLGTFAIGNFLIDNLYAIDAGNDAGSIVLKNIFVTGGFFLIIVLICVALTGILIVTVNVMNLTYCMFCLTKNLKTGLPSTIIQVFFSCIYLASIIGILTNYFMR